MSDSILKPDANEISNDKPAIIVTDDNNKTIVESNNSDSNGDCVCPDVPEQEIYDSSLDKPISVICYDLEEEQNIEKLQNEYHIEKQSSDWYYAKMIVSHAYQNKNNTELFSDHLEKQLHKNNDSFENITTAYYKNDLDIDIIYEFSQEPAKHLVDNLRIPAYKPQGIIFSNPEDANKWSFKIVVITTKGIYSANRYITEELIGCY